MSGLGATLGPNGWDVPDMPSTLLTAAQLAALAPIIPAGVSDNVAVNAAIVAANAAGGGVVTLGPGTFDIASAFLPLSNVWIRGSGIGVTILKLHASTAYANSANVISAVASTSADLTNFVISDLSIDGNRANQTLGSTQDNAFNGICVRGSGTGFYARNFKIERVSAYGCGYHGAAMYDGCTGFTVDDFYGTGNGFRALHVHADDSYGNADFSVTKVKSTANGVDTTTGLQTGQLSGIFVGLSNTTRGTVANCNVWDEPGVAYEVTGNAAGTTIAAEHVTFALNTAYNCGSGFKLGGGLKNVSFVANTIRNMNTTSKGAGATGAGIQFSSAGTLGADGLSFIGNIITDCSWWGIASDTATDKWKNITFSGANIIKNCGTNSAVSAGGVTTASWQNAVFSGNVIHGCNAGAGAPRQLYITGCQDSIFTSNTIDSGTASYPSVDAAASATNVIFTNNYVNRSSGSGTAVSWAATNSCIADNILEGTNTINVTGAGNYGAAFETTTAAGVAAGTLLNSPVAGNPTAWVNVMVDGVAKVIPAW